MERNASRLCRSLSAVAMTVVLAAVSILPASAASTGSSAPSTAFPTVITTPEQKSTVANDGFGNSQLPVVLMASYSGETTGSQNQTGGNTVSTPVSTSSDAGTPSSEPSKPSLPDDIPDDDRVTIGESYIYTYGSFTDSSGYPIDYSYVGSTNVITQIYNHKYTLTEVDQTSYLSGYYTTYYYGIGSWYRTYTYPHTVISKYWTVTDTPYSVDLSKYTIKPTQTQVPVYTYSLIEGFTEGWESGYYYSGYRTYLASSIVGSTYSQYNTIVKKGVTESSTHPTSEVISNSGSSNGNSGSSNGNSGSSNGNSGSSNGNSGSSGSSKTNSRHSRTSSTPDNLLRGGYGSFALVDNFVNEIIISDEEIPLADVPQTGDVSLLWPVLSGLTGAAVLLGRKRRRTNKA